MTRRILENLCVRRRKMAPIYSFGLWMSWQRWCKSIRCTILRDGHSLWQCMKSLCMSLMRSQHIIIPTRLKTSTKMNIMSQSNFKTKTQKKKTNTISKIKNWMSKKKRNSNTTTPAPKCPKTPSQKPVKSR